ncbi:MAG TPA: hypothetical protein VII63_06830 [Caulobacteraceae bacterium]
MLTAAAMAMGLIGSGGWTTTSRYSLDGWRLTVTHDRFSGSVSCSIKTSTVRLVRDTLIFRMGRDAQTADAKFRVDTGPVMSVRVALAEDQARGFFPDRGWIEDPSETAVALPATYARAARAVWIRANIRARPRYFRVQGLAEVLRAANGQGCAARPL